MSRPKDLSSLLNIRADEGQLVALMLAYSFLLGFARIITRSAAMGLFLADYDAQALPYIYIGVSLVVTLLSYIYLKLGQRFALPRLLVINGGFLLVVSFILWLGVRLLQVNWLTFGLPIWYEVLWTLTSLAFWNLTGRLFDLRQGKRLFGLIGAGEPVAILIGGFLVPPLVQLLGTANLLLVAGGAVVGILAVQLYINRLFGGKLNLPGEENNIQTSGSVASLLKNRYVALIGTVFGLMIVAYYFIDNIFYAQAQGQFVDEEALTSFVGIFFGLIGLLGLVVRIFVAGPVFSRYGVRTAALIEPVTLIIAVGLIAITGTLSTSLLLLFWLTAGTKFLNLVLLEAIDLAALKIFYQPLSPFRRTQVQTLIEGIVYPVSIGLAGVSLLVFNAGLGFGYLQVIYVLLFILLFWLISAILLGREYPTALKQALVNRKLRGVTLSFEDEASQSVLRQALAHSHPGVTLYALNTLEESQAGLLPDVLPDLLNHPAVEVRVEALHRIEQHRLAALREAVEQLLSTDPVSAVQAAALQALAAIGQHETIEQIYPYLDHANLELKQAAIVGLLRYSSVEVGMMAEGALLQLALSETSADRLQAAQIIGQVKLHNLHELLARLLQDRNPRVRRAALAAAGKAKYPQLWSGVVAAISVRETRSAAAASLVAGGEAVLPAVHQAVAKPDQNREALIRLVRVIGRIEGKNASNLLLDRIDFPEAELRTQILMALGRSGYRAEQPAEQLRIRARINAEVEFAAETLAALLDVGDGQPVSLLADALEFRLSQTRLRLFWLLSFIYDHRTVWRVWDNLLLPATDKKAYALETVETMLPAELTRLLLPLLEELSPDQRLQRLGAVFPQPRLAQEQRLHELLTGSDGRYSPWLLACILHTIGALRLSTPEMIGAIMTVARSANPYSLVGDTAAWALSQFDRDAFESALAQLDDNAAPEIIETAQGPESAKIGGQSMLSTVERVLVLKTVNLFSNTPDEILAEVATLLEEVELLAGQTIFEKGTPGDCMYLIVSGRLKAHDGDHLLNYLEAGDVFGEMALLNPEPRLASITAVEDTHLLRLDQEPFYELMDDHIDVARGVIQVLSIHLRNRVQDVTELKARVKELDAER